MNMILFLRNTLTEVCEGAAVKEYHCVNTAEKEQGNEERNEESVVVVSC